MSTNMIQCQYKRPEYGLCNDDSKKIFFIFFTEVEAYAQWLQDHGRRPTTVQSNKGCLISMSKRIIDTLGQCTFDDIKEDEVNLLLRSFDGLAESTKKAYIETFGRLVAYETGINPVANTRILWNDIQPKNRIFISGSDWPKIKQSAVSATDKLILGFGAYMGLRREEMVRIKMSDISGNMLYIRGKGHGSDGKITPKEIPMPVLTYLNDYLRERNRINPKHDQLLVRIDGKYPGKKMDGRSIRFACDTMGKRCGVYFTPHSLRRLYATTMYEATGKDIVQTKIATRHVSTDVLMNCYIYANPARQKEAVDRMLEMI